MPTSISTTQKTTSPSSADMFKALIKDIAARKAITRLTDSALGRALLKKLVSLASEKLGVPLEAHPCPDAPGFWLVTAGAHGADLNLQCSIRTGTLAEIIELAAHAWLEDKPLDKDEVQALLLRSLNIKPPSGDAS